MTRITLAPPTGLPPTVPAPKAIAAIAKGKTESSFPLDLNAKTPLGEYFVLVTAKTKFQGKDYAGSAPPLLLVARLAVRFASRAGICFAQSWRQGENQGDGHA